MTRSSNTLLCSSFFFVIQLLITGTLNGAITGKRITWISAHPDDEVLAGTALTQLCATNECLLVVLTRGEAGTCHRTSCRPSLAAVREEEMRRAAEFLGARLVHLSYRDGSGSTPAEVLRAWTSRAAVDVQRLVGDFKSDLVITLDPRHGSTCHPDHRAVGQLVAEAVEGWSCS